MYIQTLCSIVPTQTDYATVKAKFTGLEDTNVTGTMTNQIQRMLNNIDTLSGPGSSKTLLDRAGVKAGDIANLSPDDRTRLAEKVTNRYMSAIKEAAGDTSGGFADLYGNYKDEASAGGAVTTGTAAAAVPPVEPGVSTGPYGPTQSGDDDKSADPAGVLVDIVMRSVAFQLPGQGLSEAGRDTSDSNVASVGGIPKQG